MDEMLKCRCEHTIMAVTQHIPLKGHGHNVSAYSRRSVTLRGVVKYQPGNAPRVLALELTGMFR